MSSTTTLKDEGNEKFKNGDFDGAMSCYTQALEISEIKETEKAVIFKNRAMCRLKVDDFEGAVSDATKALEIAPNDPKALYRRCTAYESLGKVEDAYRDAAMLIKIDPKNPSVGPILNRLTPIIRQKAEQQNSTVSRVAQMFNIAFETNEEKDKRVQAMNNLVVLSRDEAGCQIIMAEGGLPRIKEVLFKEKDADIIQATIRVLACMTHTSRKRSENVYEHIGIVRLGQLMAMPVESLCTSVALLLQNMINTIAEISIYKAEFEKYKEKRRQGDPAIPPKFDLDEYQQKFIDEMFLGLIKMLQHRKVSAHGRDASMELMIKNLTRKDSGIHWTRKFIETDEGIEGLLMIAGSIKQHEGVAVTEQSKMHASLLLNNVWEDLLSDKERDIFKEKVSLFFKDLFGDDHFESKVEAVKAISMLLQGPFEVGSMILGFEGVTEIMLQLAQSDRALHQQVAVEAIIHSSSKKDKCTGMLKEGVPALKELYHNGANDHIKVRALVGLCKLGSFGGSDASNRPMADGSTVTLAKSCRKFLTNPLGDHDMKQWGTEGLAYLTLDADVKEELVHDEKALKAVIEVAQNPVKSFMYAAATLFVNLTNSTDKQEMVPEMVELAKYAKQHVPEEHPKDKEEFVKQRVKILVEAGAVSGMVSLSKSDSQNTREQVSRILLTIATEMEYRGIIVQVGGVKALLSMALDNNTDLGKQAASQALAKLTITQDPTITYPGQRIYEVVRPLISLLNVERSGLQNFEALLALTNLSSLSDSIRERIVAERGIPSMEHYLYEEHDLIRRAAVECMCNMVMNEKVAKLFEGDNDRVKHFTLLCGDEDEKIVIGASGAMAVLATEKAVCQKIVEVKEYYNILLSLAVNANQAIQHRGCHLIMNIVLSEKEIAEKVLAGQILEVLMAISVLTEPEKQGAKSCAETTLEKATEYGIVKPNKGRA